jgi:hypothetical protein
MHVKAILQFYQTFEVQLILRLASQQRDAGHGESKLVAMCIPERLPKESYSHVEHRRFENLSFFAAWIMK